MGRIRFITLGVVVVLAAACGGPGGSGAPSSAAPSGSQAAVASGEPSADPCGVANLDTISAGVLTIGAGEPAYPPFFSITDPIPSDSPWSLGQPPSGEGLEAAFAYALAQRLGFTEDQVTWAVTTFNLAIQPGDKPFDLFVSEVSYSAERATAVDLSDGYFDLNQAVVGVAGSDITKVTTVAGLKPFKLGAQIGTTSYKYIVDLIKPDKEPAVYQSNDAAITALNAGQIDGIVADLPTTFYMRDAQLDHGQIVGSLPTASGQAVEHYSVLLNKGSTLTACVNAAIASLKSDGTLDGIVEDWITTQGAPALE